MAHFSPPGCLVANWTTRSRALWTDEASQGTDFRENLQGLVDQQLLFAPQMDLFGWVYILWRGVKSKYLSYMIKIWAWWYDWKYSCGEMMGRELQVPRLATCVIHAHVSSIVQSIIFTWYVRFSHHTSVHTRIVRFCRRLRGICLDLTCQIWKVLRPYILKMTQTNRKTLSQVVNDFFLHLQRNRWLGNVSVCHRRKVETI